MLEECDSILLLLARSVDVCKEKWYIMAAHQRHHASVIKSVHVGLLLVSIRSFMSPFTVVHCLVRHYGFVGLGAGVAQTFYMLTDTIDKRLRDDILWIVEMGRVSCGTAMAMVKVPIQCYMEIPTPLERRVSARNLTRLQEYLLIKSASK